jgi:hypothetical protein
MMLALVAVDVDLLSWGMLGFDRSNASASSDVDGKLGELVVSVSLWEARRLGGGGGTLAGCDKVEDLDGD